MSRYQLYKNYNQQLLHVGLWNFAYVCLFVCLSVTYTSTSKTGLLIQTGEPLLTYLTQTMWLGDPYLVIHTCKNNTSKRRLSGDRWWFLPFTIQCLTRLKRFEKQWCSLGINHFWIMFLLTFIQGHSCKIVSTIEMVLVKEINNFPLIYKKI